MDRPALDRFTRDIRRRFDHRDLEPIKWAIIRRRRVLAMPLRPQSPALGLALLDPVEQWVIEV